MKTKLIHSLSKVKVLVIGRKFSIIQLLGYYFILYHPDIKVNLKG